MIESLKCPECGDRMVSRLNRVKNQRFWGCVNYPECKGTRDTDGNSRADRESEDDSSSKDYRWRH